MRIPEGDETTFPSYDWYGTPASEAPARKGTCYKCREGITVNHEMVTCLHCDVHLHERCYKDAKLCLACVLPTERQFDGARRRVSWPCGLCQDKVVERGGFSFCAACGSKFHVKCRGFSGNCPSCGEFAPVLVNGEQVHELSIFTRFVRGQETQKDCINAWLIQSAIALNIYALIGYLGTDIGIRIVGIWCVGTMWWIYCGVLSQRREWSL
ncbi:MAG: hypothetical protein P1V97_20840 [Planctomycetota bacterium]|nr:hypothetical protein [Planctomycetota bacterium]